MNAPHLPIHSELLLAHEPFVRALASNLVRREGQADDLVQDTWLAALTHPPRSAGSVRAFLGTVARNIARNERRGAQARTHREQLAARGEMVESVASVHERLSVQRDVVDAVLTLDELYRSAILLHYYEGWSASRIAKHRGLPPGTVRSQLSRGLELLRAKLDAKFGGNRGAWGLALINWLESKSPGAPAAAISSKVVLIAVALLIPAIAPVTWLVVRGWNLSGATNELVKPLTSPDALSVLVETSAAAVSTQPASAAREPATQPHVAATATNKLDLGAKSIDELLVLSVHAQRALEQKLCTPEPSLVESQKELLQVRDTGVVRIPHYWGQFSSVISLEFADATYSLSTRYHGDVNQCDLCVRDGAFWPPPAISHPESWFAFDLGDLDLLSVGEFPPAWPEGMSAARQEAWACCWSDPRGSASDSPSPRIKHRELNLDPSVPLRVGQTVLIRHLLVGNGEHQEGSFDLLAAVRTLAIDEIGTTIAWKILRSRRIDWPDQKPWRHGLDPYGFIPAGPALLSELSIAELLARIRDIRAIATPRLLEVPEALTRRYSEFLRAPDTGLVRVLSQASDPVCGKTQVIWYGHPHGALLMEGMRDVSMYSFATRAYGWGDRGEPDIQLADGWGDRGEPDIQLAGRGDYDRKGGDYGGLLDLGRLTVTQLAALTDSPPPALNEIERETWQLLWETETESAELERTSLMERFENRRLHQSSGAFPAEVGRTYLLRNRFRGKHDVIVAFTTVARDEHGATLLWRTLHTWPSDAMRRR